MPYDYWSLGEVKYVVIVDFAIINVVIGSSVCAVKDS